MTKREAAQKAGELWGNGPDAPGFAARVSHADKGKRFVVGMILDKKPEPLGYGASFEQAFDLAASLGFTRDRILELRHRVAA